MLEAHYLILFVIYFMEYYKLFIFLVSTLGISLSFKFFQISNVITPFQTSVHKFQRNLKSISLKKNLLNFLASFPLPPLTQFYSILFDTN